MKADTFVLHHPLCCSVSHMFVWTRLSARTTPSPPLRRRIRLEQLKSFNVVNFQRWMGLADLKESLMENCNLNQPFSFSSVALGIGGGSQFVFCCHTKAGS